MENEDVNGPQQSAKRRYTSSHLVYWLLNDILGTAVQSHILPAISPTVTTNGEGFQSLDPEHYSEQIPSQVASHKDVYVGAPLKPAEELFHKQF